MSQPKVLSEVIGSILKPLGFKKKADTWFLNSDETILVFNLQKSSYGPQYYINIGVWLKPLGEADNPKEHQCHIRFRWKALIPQDEKRLERLLDLDDQSLSDQDRATEIGLLLQSYVIPFFSQAASLDGLRALHNSGSWPSCLVNRKAQELLRQTGVDRSS